MPPWEAALRGRGNLQVDAARSEENAQSPAAPDPLNLWIGLTHVRFEGYGQREWCFGAKREIVG